MTEIPSVALKDDKVIQTTKANTLEKFELGIQELFKVPMVQCMAENDGIVTRYMDDMDFQRTVLSILARDIYKAVLNPAEQNRRFGCLDVSLSLLTVTNHKKGGFCNPPFSVMTF